jgi:hypothetical protein
VVIRRISIVRPAHPADATFVVYGHEKDILRAGPLIGQGDNAMGLPWDMRRRIELRDRDVLRAPVVVRILVEPVRNAVFIAVRRDSGRGGRQRRDRLLRHIWKPFRQIFSQCIKSYFLCVPVG